MKQIFTLLLGLFLIMSCGVEKKEMVDTVAHRGASGHAPENTLSALKKAIEFNSEYSEIDVQETMDGEIILLHDGTTKRTTGENLNIWEMNYDDIKDLDAGSWFSVEYLNEPIPKLSEVIDLVKGKMKLNIELKTNRHEKMLAERALKVVEDHKFLDNVVFTSFSINEIRKIRELNKSAKIGFIFSRMPKDFDVFTEDIDMLSVGKNLVDEDFVKKAKEHNKEIAVWTVNKPEEMKRLISLGVDAIITNYPDILKDLQKTN